MTKEIDRALICVFVFILVFGVLYLSQMNKNPRYISYQPREIIKKSIPKEELKEEPKKEIKEELKKEERKLPCPGTVRPLSITYKIENGIAIKNNVIKNNYFNCTVMRKINIKNDTYYKVTIKQLPFLEETHIVQESDIIFRTSSLLF